MTTVAPSRPPPPPSLNLGQRLTAMLFKDGRLFISPNTHPAKPEGPNIDQGGGGGGPDELSKWAFIYLTPVLTNNVL